MAIRPIVLYPEPVLLEPTEKIGEITDEIRAIVRDMVETMYAEPGVGLAANQVGVPKRLMVVDLSVGENPGDLRVFVNPEILAAEGSQTGDEGCLSFPGITLQTERPFRVTVEARNLEGVTFRFVGEGLMARALVHEIAHLDGTTFLDAVSPLKRGIVKRQIRKRIRDGTWNSAAAK